VIRPLVVPRGPDVTITNLTADLGATVLVDGQPVGTLATGERVVVSVGSQHSLLATLPEVTFFSRYAATFGR
jgi:NAD kinase